MTDQAVLKTSLGAVWVQPDGPNTEPRYLGCVDLGDVTDPKFESEIIQCFDPMGGWKTVGQRFTPPGNVETQLDELLFEQRSWLEQIDYVFSMFILMRAEGRPDLFNNFVRAFIFENARITASNLTNLVHHVEDNESMGQFPIQADPPLLRTGKLTVDRISTAETEALNSLAWRPDPILWNKLKATDKPGKYGGIACDSAVGPATGDFLYTDDKGANFVASATDPFGAGFNTESVISFFIDKDTERFLLARLAPPAGQGQVAFSDDNGATWTVVSVGGAGDGHGAFAGAAHALFALDQYNVFLASEAGYIYKSTDGGASWTAVEQGIITADAWIAVHMKNSLVGMAISETDDIAVTHDGGLTWSAVTATGDGGVLKAVQDAGDLWWVYTDSNALFYSEDEGETWAEREGYPGAGTGDGKDMIFLNSLVGYLLYNDAVPDGYLLRTIDGGFTWKTEPFKGNAGLNSLAAVDMNRVWAVGEPDGGTGVILRYTWI